MCPKLIYTNVLYEPSETCTHMHCEVEFGVAVSLWMMQLRTLIYLAVVADFGVPIPPGFYIPISATICLAQSISKLKLIEGEHTSFANGLCAKFHGII